MRRKWMVLLGIALLTTPVFAQEQPALKNEKEKLSYALGMDLGNQPRKMAVDIDPALFGKGPGDALSGGKTLLTEEEVRAAVAALQAEMRQKQIAAARTASENNKKAGDAFLAENKAKEGVVALPSGLQYKILKAGEGRTPTRWSATTGAPSSTEPSSTALTAGGSHRRSSSPGSSPAVGKR